MNSQIFFFGRNNKKSTDPQQTLKKHLFYDLPPVQYTELAFLVRVFLKNVVEEPKRIPTEEHQSDSITYKN